MHEAFVGHWETDPDDPTSQQTYGKASITFKPGGELIYTLFLKGKVQKIFLTYEIKGNCLMTSQAASKQVEETEFKFLPDGKLELTFDGVKSRYVKVAVGMD